MGYIDEKRGFIYMVMDKTENLEAENIASNASQITLSNAQTQMKGEVEKVGFQTETDVVGYIKELRDVTNCDLIKI